MKNRFFTVLVIPEKTSSVTRFVVPGWLLRGAVVGTLFTLILAVIMIFDYWYVMSQVSEYRQVKLENRRLQGQVQLYKTRMSTIESTLDRVKTFSTRLKVITNIEDRGNLLQSLNQKLPDAAQNVGQTPTLVSASGGSPWSLGDSGEASARRDPERARMRKEREELTTKLESLARDSSLIEQTLQDQYELLVDQKAFLAALPTRKPAIGYFTNGFGVRRSPFGGREKMHEGLDIANRPGTPIRASADGVVVFANAKAGYGQTLILDHGYGLETWYAHNRKLLVSNGQKVKRGDVVALLGNSGRSTGPHLHYEVRVNGTPVDPLSYILEN